MSQTTESKKQRVNLSLDEDALKMGEELAEAERRSLSNLVEVLFAREYDRLFGKADGKGQMALELPVLPGKEKAA